MSFGYIPNTNKDLAQLFTRHANGGLASAADFEGYKPEWVTPLETDYRGRSVRVMPPNSYGVLMLMQLNALSGLSSEEIAADEATRVGYLMRAMHASFVEGQHHIADPRTNPAPVNELLGAAMTARLRKAAEIGDHPALSHPPGGTSCITIADASGDAVSVVQSVFHVFGGAFLDPGTGILMNNRMTGFVTDPSVLYRCLEESTRLGPGGRPHGQGLRVGWDGRDGPSLPRGRHPA